MIFEIRVCAFLFFSALHNKIRVEITKSWEEK